MFSQSDFDSQAIYDDLFNSLDLESPPELFEVPQLPKPPKRRPPSSKRISISPGIDFIQYAASLHRPLPNSFNPNSYIVLPMIYHDIISGNLKAYDSGYPAVVISPIPEASYDIRLLFSSIDHLYQIGFPPTH